MRHARPTPVGSVSGVPFAGGLAALRAKAAINIPVVLRAEAFPANTTSENVRCGEFSAAQLAWHSAAKTNDSVLKTGFCAVGAERGIGCMGSVATGGLICKACR